MKTTPSNRKQKAEISISKILSSLSEIIRTLALVAYQASEDSGDGAYYVREGLGGRQQLYSDYWGNQYQIIFFSAYYMLDEKIRMNQELTKFAKAAPSSFKKHLKDKKACDLAYKELVFPSKRLDSLRLFDGKRMRKFKVCPRAEILQRIKEDGLGTANL